MNYIPGFSNYLQASVPRYAKGGPARFAGEDVYNGAQEDVYYGDGGYSPEPTMYTEPYAAPAATASYAAPAVMDAAAPVDYSGLAGLDLSGLAGMNFGSDFSGGGVMGSTGQAPSGTSSPYVKPYAGMSSDFATNDGKQGYYFTTDKGASAGYKGGSGFVASDPNAQYRLTDERGKNKVVYTGQGEEALRNVYEKANELSISGGKKANWGVEMLDPATGKWTRVVENDPAKGLGVVGDVLGTALPLAAMFVPGLNVLGTIALGAGLGGAGAALKGDNILKGAVMGGLSSAGGAVLGPALGGATGLSSGAARAIGTGIGSTAGGLATGQSLENALIGGALSGGLSYITPSIQEGLGIGQGPSASTGGGGADSGAVYGGPNADIIVNAPSFSTPNINLGGYKTPTQKFVDKATDIVDPTTGLPYSSDIINVTGSVPGAVTGGLNLSGGTPTAQQPTVDGIAPEDLITVTGERPGAVTGGLDLGAITPTAQQPTVDGIAPEDLITVTGERPGAVTGGLNLGGGTPTTAPATDIVVTGPGKTEPVTGGDFSNITDIDKAVVTETEKPPEKKLGAEDYLRIASLLAGLIPGGKGGSGSPGTYGGSGSGRLNPIFSSKLPTANIPGGVGSASNLGARQMGEQDWLTYGQRPELSFYNYVPRPTGMAEGGALPAKRGGSPDRTEFAVNGPGTGRSDDIPAVLSDGEYVIDAETVALLGDGSSKAGAKKLDDLRVKVRKHKGKKLAKGRFSANAKKPEAYLSGGRI